MQDRIKVLHIVSGLNFGGVGMMLYNYYSHMDRNNISFDFITHGENIGYIEKKFVELGSKIYHIPPKNQNIYQNFSQIKRR